MGIQSFKKKREGPRKPANWGAVFNVLTKPSPHGIGLSYPEAANLTIAQLKHALGIKNTELTGSDIYEAQRKAQFDGLDRICTRLNMLPFDLEYLPTSEIKRQIKADTAEATPTSEQIQSTLKLYLESKT